MNNLRKFIHCGSSSWASADPRLTQPLEEEQILDEPASKFTWKIPKFSKLAKSPHFSRTFLIRGRQWKIQIEQIMDHLSLFLVVPDAETLPQGWKQFPHFSFNLVNQINQYNSKNHGGAGEFSERATCRGFSRFIPLRELKDQRKGYLVNDTLILEAEFQSMPTGELTVSGRKLIWKITNFCALTAKLAFSPTFEHGGCNWYLMTFPVGNITDKTHFFLYLQVDFLSLSEERTINTKYRLYLLNQNDSCRSITAELQKKFRHGRTISGSKLIAFSELRDRTKGFIVNDTLIVEADFILPEVEPSGEQLLEPANFTWKITNFSRLNAAKYYSQIFIIGGSSWRLLIYPDGSNGTAGLSAYLEVVCSETRQQGWMMSAEFSIILVNQIDENNSVINRRQTRFNSRSGVSGFSSIVSLTELLDHSNGYRVDDTVIMKVEFELPEDQSEPEPESGLQPDLEPEYSQYVDPTDTQLPADMFDSYFSNLDRLITGSEVSSCDVNAPALSKPSLEEVEKAKQSLKECLSDLFKLNMKERLAEALLTLSLAEAELTADQQKSVKTFQANFREFTADFLAFEQDNAEFELLKVQKDELISTMKRSHETHLSLKNLKDELAREAAELERRLQQVNTRREKLTSEWEILLAGTEEARCEYEIVEKKVAEAEEKKRIAEERMSRSAGAWSDLKAHFA